MRRGSGFFRLAGGCVILLASACYTYAAPTVDPTARTIMQGLEHRMGLLRTFEGYVSSVSFFNARKSAAHSQPQRPNYAQLHYWLADISSERWLVEIDTYSLEPVPLYHVVSVFDRGHYAFKRLDDSSPWGRPDQPIEDFAKLKSAALLMQSLPGDYIQDYVTHIATARTQIDGHECIYLRLTQPARSDTDVVQYIHFWVDPSIGFAIRRWGLSGVEGGLPVLAIVRDASDFYEYSEGLWLPRSLQVITATQDAVGAGWRWQELTKYRVLAAQVNQSLTGEYLDQLQVAEEFEPADYDPRLTSEQYLLLDDNGQEVQDDGREQQTDEEPVTVQDVKERLLATLKTGPDDVESAIALAIEIGEELVPTEPPT